MTIKDCIKNAVDAGELTLEEGQSIGSRFDALFRQLNSKGAAREQLLEELEIEKLERKRRALLTETIRKKLEQQVLGYRDGKGRADPGRAFQMMHEHFGGAKFQDMENLRLAIMGGAHAKLEALLHEFRKGALKGDLRRRGGKAKARLDNVVRELFGQDSADARAKELAKAWQDVSEDLRQRYNAAGGSIRKLNDWGLPQHHDRDALLSMGRAGWVDHITPMLDREKMVNHLTGKNLTDDELREGLELIWERITTDGWIDREPTGIAVGKGALYKQHADSRFLHFKDADTWLKYQRDFGEGDPFASMMGHLSTMSRDIAAMETFGPNPELIRNYLKQVISSRAARQQANEIVVSEQRSALQDLTDRLFGAKSKAGRRLTKINERIGGIHGELENARKGHRTKRNKRRIVRLQKELFSITQEAQGLRSKKPDVTNDEVLQYHTMLDDLRQSIDSGPGSDPVSRANAMIANADAMWDIQRGTANTPVDNRIANVLVTTRNLVAASTLGSAAISALSDLGFNKMTRQFVGLPPSITGVVSQTVGMFKPANRREAVRAGLILDNAMHAMHQQARYVGSVDSRSKSGYLVDRVLALSGLTPWTQAGKHAFGLAFQAELADRVKLKFHELPDALSNTLERHGLTHDDWDVIRSSQLYEPERGATFLRPNEVAQGVGGRELSEKYISMILRETRFAVPEGSVRSRTILTGGKPGTLMGEISRNFAQFKSFGISVMMLHGGRIASEIGSGYGARGAMYAGSILITTTLLGAGALQLKALANGEDPRDMTELEFWGAALLQGGGLGIYGDFLFSGVNRFGGGLTSTVAGPLTGKLDKARNFGFGNVAQGGAGERTNAGREAIGVIRDWTPGGNMWYVRAAYERVVLDQLQTLIDPEARRAFKRRMKFREQNFGNGYWWAPGQASPGRAPSFGSALGQ